MLTKTNTLLLQQLEDPTCQDAWREFDDRYRPVLQAFARRLGLDGPEAEEASQATLARFVEHYLAGKYDRSRGRLRTWIFAIARNCIRDLLGARWRRRHQRGHSALNRLESDASIEAIWEEEWRRVVAHAALSELSTETGSDPRTVQVFERLVMQGCAPREVASEFGMTTNAVYVAKHRAIQRLRTIMARLQDEF